MDASNGCPSATTLPTRPLSIRTKPRAAAAEWTTDDSMEEKAPVTPTARLMENVYIIITIGIGSSLNIPVFSAGIASQLARYQRFQSIQVADGSKDGNRRWARVKVKVDDHIIIPTLDPLAVEADADQVLEDYVASLLALPMDPSRPLWEFHFLDFPTSEATSTLAILRWVWSYVLLAWNTMVDVAFFVATVMFLQDPKTLFKYYDNTVVNPRRRFVHRTLSFDDVKLIKNAVNCTVNDVLVGATSAALSQYYFRKSGNTNTKKVCLRSVLPVNLRETSSLQKNVNMIESGKSDDVTWGNQLGYVILPFHLARHHDPLEYVHKAKKTMDRKKASLEVVFTCKISEVFLQMFGIKPGAFIFRRMFANTIMAFSNMIGPAEPTEMYGHPIMFIAPSVYGVPQALIVHYQSYGSTMTVTLSVDDEIFPDYSQLLDDFIDSFGHIKDAASRL